MSDFPPATVQKEHSEFYGEETVDPNIRAEMEGGYDISRARYNRDARRIFKTGWKLLYDNEKTTLDNFQKGRKYTALSFTYTIPTSGEVVIVKFERPLKFNYIGMGPTKLWECKDVILKEV